MKSTVKEAMSMLPLSTCTGLLSKLNN
uniref:Uncharacterized protein n=1 Tax=Arundo donax TaxID=35708 RepID=A0A0A8ZF59_ARUDO